MQQSFSRWGLAGLLLASFHAPLHADIEDAESIPFPVLDATPSDKSSVFPYLTPRSDDAPQWPPLFKSPAPETLPRGPVASKRIAPMSEMDALPAPPKIAVIIDDVGYNRRGMEETLALPLPVVLAILPETPYAKKTAQRAHLQERITILHAPMENERELKLGPGGLYVRMEEEEFKQTLRADLDNVPYVKGVNNHMGSLLTTQGQHMAWVMDIMTERSLFFIDSLTSAQSVAHTQASERGIPTLIRDVFLDNVRTEEAIHRQFQQLLTRAHQRGSAVAIGHPYPETTAYLQQRLNQPLSAQLVTIDHLLK
ncbi:Divergent polysaccharide deacetylase [Marinomonas aquimarina]|uniref:Divergent polysaccharide deacetylase n=1 Tax=Marinomonas aquimarina TaxID=295068 RepID=A0A1A8TQM5_9GAMM|nr:divergent polysaccharide deacetylase family protein [Marinomonas aquimarina]SBS35435.1 Divergent polysaccharide deacetylase [Marinomonas aquimarina]